MISYNARYFSVMLAKIPQKSLATAMPGGIRLDLQASLVYTLLYRLQEWQHDARFLEKRLVVHLIPFQVAFSRLRRVLERRMASMCLTKDAHSRRAVRL